MDKKWVVFLGAGNSQVELIKKAAELGYRVLAIDQNDKAPGFNFADKKIVESTHDFEAIIKNLDIIDFSGIVARTTGKALFTAASLSKKYDIPGINFELANIATSKSALRNFCISKDIKVPHGEKISTISDLDQDRFVDQIIVKPDFTITGKKSISKVKLSNEQGLENAIDLALLSSGNKYVEVEEFIEGYDCTYLTWIKNGIPSILLSWDELNSYDENNYLYQIGVSMPSISLFINHSEKILQIINKFAKFFPDVNSLLAFSFIVDERGYPFLIELHADLTGDQILDKLAPVVTNSDALLEIVKLLINKNSNLSSCLKKFSKQKPSALIYENNLKDLVISKDDIFLLHEEIKSLTRYKII